MHPSIKSFIGGMLAATALCLLAVSCTGTAPAAETAAIEFSASESADGQPEPLFDTSYQPETVDYEKIWRIVEEDNAAYLKTLGAEK